MKIYVGHDSREDIAYQVCEHSIKRRDPSAEVIPLKQKQMRDQGLYTRPVDNVKLSNKITGGGYKRSFQEQQDRYEVSSQYSIGPAYNKGGYQVLSKADQKDPATGKRR